jgi:hypothetical protein
MDPVTAIALTLGAGWASGINLYAAILTLGFMQNTGGINLPPDLQILGSPLVLAAAGIMYVIEFFADKIPGVDSVWDALHTFIRIPAGALLASQAVGDMSPALSLAAGLMGGTLAATSHAAKASTRVLINTSPEPFSNWAASITEDIAVFGGLYTAMNHPIIFLILLVAFVAAVIWLLPKIFRLLGKLFRKIGAFFRGERAPDVQPLAATAPPPPRPPEPPSPPGTVAAG